MLSATSHPTSRKRFGTFTLRARLIVDPAVRIVDAVMVEKKTVVPWMVEPVRVETFSSRVLIVLPVSVEYDTLPAFKVDAMTVELLRSTLR